MIPINVDKPVETRFEQAMPSEARVSQAPSYTLTTTSNKASTSMALGGENMCLPRRSPSSNLSGICKVANVVVEGLFDHAEGQVAHIENIIKVEEQYLLELEATKEKKANVEVEMDTLRAEVVPSLAQLV
uniref:Uncharacterized protein n=1 Tax=Nelumbo nucifera TaxID=4432 RepID=A0A822ZVA6_NELNU|nr:TPA_asm: hypothetical protein HUJ06_016743 [Nelumbo nucifera]